MALPAHVTSAVVQDWVARCGASPRLVAPPPSTAGGQHVDVDAALVLLIRSCRSPRAAQALREAVEIWLTVGCCCGFAFHENPSFWRRSLVTPRVSAVVDARLAAAPARGTIPRIVIKWLPRSDCRARDEAAMTQRAALFLKVFFRVPWRAGIADAMPYSEVYHTYMEMLRPFVAESRWRRSLPLACGVDLSFRNVDAAVGVRLNAVSSLVHHVTANDQQPASAKAIGVQLRLASVHLSWFMTPALHDVRVFLEALPPRVTVSMDRLDNWRDFAVETKAEQFGFLAAAFGCDATSAGGCMDVLSFTRPIQSGRPRGLESLSSLLPYARSIRRVELNVGSLRDWLWLVYAMFHPQSASCSSWRELKLWSARLEASDVAVVKWFVRAGCPAVMLRGDCSVQDVAALVDTIETFSASAERRRLAVSGEAVRLCTAEGEDIVDVVVAAGTPLDVCDPAAAKANGSDRVDVVAAGYGLGWVAASAVRPVEDEARSANCHASCITSIEFPPMDHGGLRQAHHPFVGLTETLSGSLQQLRGSKLLSWRELKTLSLDKLQLVDACTFGCRDDDGRCSKPWRSQLPQLQSLAVYLDSRDLAHLLDELLGSTRDDTDDTSHPLRRLRLHVSVSAEDNDDSNAMAAQLSRLIRHQRSLQSLDVRLDETSERCRIPMMKHHFPALDATPWRSKRAFLSCCRRTPDNSFSPSVTSMQSLSVETKTLVLSCLGRGVETFVMSCRRHGVCLMDGRVHRRVLFQA